MVVFAFSTPWNSHPARSKYVMKTASSPAMMSRRKAACQMMSQPNCLILLSTNQNRCIKGFECNDSATDAKSSE